MFIVLRSFSLDFLNGNIHGNDVAWIDSTSSTSEVSRMNIRLFSVRRKGRCQTSTSTTYLLNRTTELKIIHGNDVVWTASTSGFLCRMNIPLFIQREKEGKMSDINNLHLEESEPYQEIGKLWDKIECSICGDSSQRRCKGLNPGDGNFAHHEAATCSNHDAKFQRCSIHVTSLVVNVEYQSLIAFAAETKRVYAFGVSLQEAPGLLLRWIPLAQVKDMYGHSFLRDQLRQGIHQLNLFKRRGAFWCYRSAILRGHTSTSI